MRLPKHAAGLGVICACMTTDAHAQVNQGVIAAPAYQAEISLADDLQRQETVTTRPHPETDPLGVDLGGWVLLPSVGAEEQYNDNIYATSSATHSDFITTISPDLLLRSNWNNSQVTLEAGSQDGIYASHTTENFNDYNVAATGRLDITRQDYIAVKGGYYFLHEPRTSPNNNFGTVPTTYGQTNGQIEYYHGFNRLSLTVDGVLNRYVYEDVGDGTGGFIPNTDRTRSEYGGAGRLAYELQPQMEVFVRAEETGRFYDHKIGTDGYQRSSTGYDATGGLTFDLGGTAFGEVGVGYMSRAYYDDRFGTVSGVTANVAVTWNLTPITTLKLTGQRSIEETITFGSPGFVASTGTLTADHELLRNLLLNASVGLTYDDYQRSTQRETVVSAAFGVTYILNRYAKLSARYGYRDQDSNPSDLGYKQNLALVRLTLQM